jgi:hypothetical protein
MESRMNPRRAVAAVALLVAPVLACGSPSQAPAGELPAPARQGPDTSGSDLVPPGYGTLRQDDISVRLQLPSVLVRAIPLDESVIRVLSPDSYRALRELKEGRRREIDALASRRGLRNPSLWYISFFGLEPDTRFDPMDLVITGSGRDYRPLEVLALSTGFNSQRIRQRETQSAIYLFDESLDVNQPLVVAMDTVRSASWGGTVRTIERERALVRSRAAQGPRPQ